MRPKLICARMNAFNFKWAHQARDLARIIPGPLIETKTFLPLLAPSKF